MQHRIQHLLTHLVLTSSIILCSCSGQTENRSFKTPSEALEACKSIINDLTAANKTDMNSLAEKTNEWLVIQDSAYSCLLRDTSMALTTPYSIRFFELCDSVRIELLRLATASEHSLREIVVFKRNTAYQTEKIQDSNDYATALTYFGDMDGIPLFSTPDSTITEYNKLLSETKPFIREGTLYTFIRKEDKCFRSLMMYIDKVSPTQMQNIADKTSRLFDVLYRTAAEESDDEVNQRVKTYLVMRLNRRLLQNCQACRQLIKKGITLNDEQKDSFRWMLLQPFMVIDNVAMAYLTKEQLNLLTEIADDIPQLLRNIDDDTQNAKELAALLSEYLLKAYLNQLL